jgi:tetratricopeptide (TPR) repeat protein
MFYDEGNMLSTEYLRSITNPDILLNAAEQAALLVFNANITYGEGDDQRNTQLLVWADDMLTDTKHLFLRGRGLEIKLAIGFYEQGNYEGGATAAESFLESVKGIKPDERTNAQIGMIQVVLAEMLVTEPDLDADFQKSLDIYHGWKYIDPDHPSTREHMTKGVISQTCGQTYKDKGDWQASADELSSYLSDFAVSGSQNEGWAAGDLGQVLMEMGRLDEADVVLEEHLQKRVRHLTPRERERDRRSDTMFLEINAAELLLLQGRIPDAERAYRELQSRFERFASRSELPHFEKTRVFFILCGLARCAQLSRDYYVSVKRWEEVLSYASSEMNVGFQKGKWGRDSYYTGVILLSMANCWYGMTEHDHEKDAEEARWEGEEILRKHARKCWMLGLGSYWPEEMQRQLRERDGRAEAKS